MGRGIEIPLSLNPRELIRGLRITEQAFEGLEDSLDEVAREGDQLEKSLEDNFRDIQRKAKDIDVTPDTDANKSAAGVLAGEVVDEFVENWGEAVRSGDYAGAIRETLSQLGQIGGAIGGPAGAAIGGAAALFFTNAFDQFMDTEGKERLQNTLKATTDGIDVDAGESGYLTGQSFIEGYDRAMREQANRENALMELYGVDTYQEALRLAADEVDELGIAWGALEDVTAGTTTETKAAVGNLEDQRDILNDDIARIYEENNGTLKNATEEQRDQVVALTDQRDRINDLIELGEDRLGVTQDTADAIDAQAGSLVSVEGKAKNVRRAIEDIPDKRSVDVQLQYQGEIQRFNAAMFDAVRPRYQKVFIETVRSERTRFDNARAASGTRN